MIVGVSETINIEQYCQHGEVYHTGGGSRSVERGALTTVYSRGI